MQMFFLYKKYWQDTADNVEMLGLQSKNFLQMHFRIKKVLIFLSLEWNNTSQFCLKASIITN